jgi:hypothetical protein
MVRELPCPDPGHNLQAERRWLALRRKSHLVARFLKWVLPVSPAALAPGQPSVLCQFAGAVYLVGLLGASGGKEERHWQISLCSKSMH